MKMKNLSSLESLEHTIWMYVRRLRSTRHDSHLSTFLYNQW